MDKRDIDVNTGNGILLGDAFYGSDDTTIAQILIARDYIMTNDIYHKALKICFDFGHVKLTQFLIKQHISDHYIMHEDYDEYDGYAEQEDY